LPTPDFCKNLLDFTALEKDLINDETVDLLEPYLTLEHPKFPADKDGKQTVFNKEIAAKVSSALAGLTVWCKAMSMYQKATKVVKPKMEALNRAKTMLEEANMKLAAAEAQLMEVRALTAELKRQADEANAQKEALQASATATRQKMS